jgi:GMP synthase-like glutamine amidotransferase
MKTLCVVQHIESEYLGFLEDHLESRSIRFRYFRPFTASGKLPDKIDEFDGLVLLGAGPFGIVSGPLLPSLGPELRLARRFLDRGRPAIGFGFGAILLTVAAGGGAEEKPLRFEVGTAHRETDEALFGTLPERFPYCAYLRDRPVLPAGAHVLASAEGCEPLIYSMGANALAFIGHPGFKAAMAEDIVMEFEETPPETIDALTRLRDSQAGIAEALSAMIVGIVRQCDWMAAPSG